MISIKSNLCPSFFILSSSVTIFWSSWNLLRSCPNKELLPVSSKGLFKMQVKLSFGRSISSSSSSTLGPDSMKLYVFIFVSSVLMFNLLYFETFAFLTFDFGFLKNPFRLRLKILLSIFSFLINYF